MKKALACLLAFLVAASPTWASSGPDQNHMETIRKKVARCVDKHMRVVVVTCDNRRLQGVISEAGGDDFVLVFASRATTLSYSNVRKISWPSPAWKHGKAFAVTAGVTAGIFGLVVLLGGLKG